MKTQDIAVQATETTVTTSFADRIKLLIQQVGSATAIARMCGFSEGVVRSWRDGSTDPSRARCVTLARTLGISLVWLVAGEGSLKMDPNLVTYDDQSSTEKVSSHHSRSRPLAQGAMLEFAMDTQRLNTAVRILQSELSLADGQLSLADNADLLTHLYEILGPNGAHVDPLEMVAFNQQLGERIRKTRETA